MILVYYNPNHQCFYQKEVKNADGLYVGYKNQYEHVIVQIFMITDEGLLSVKSRDDYWLNYLNKNNKHLSYKHRIINRAIDLLDKLK